MKKYLIIFFWLVTTLAEATNYYVKTGGNDASAGTSDATAWATITKVNTAWAAGSFAPGDNIYFNRGDTFTGTITVSESGTTGSPITIGAYGTGVDPIISGFTTITGWTNEGGGIYSKTVSVAASPIIVSIDGVNTAMGRTPNTGWWTIDSDTQNSITDADLNSAVTNWTGADVVVRVGYYTINHVPVTSHVSHTLNFTMALSDAPSNQGGNGYFLQSDIRTLDATNEWFYGGGDFHIYGDPAAKIVKVASIQNAVEINSHSYITFDNLNIQGFNNHAFNIDLSPHITIQNCAISFIGCNVVDGYDNPYTVGASTGLAFTGNTVSDIGNDGFHLYGGFTNVTITNNTFNNIGLIRGQGYQTDIYAYTGIYLGEYVGTSSNVTATISYNTWTNIGYIPINVYNGNGVTVSYNYINNACLILDDGGGIYTYFGSTARTCLIDHNIVLNVMGEGTGRTDPPTYLTSAGIYCDNSTQGITITNNTISGCSFGYTVNGNSAGVVTDNTFYDSRIVLRLNALNFDFQRNIVFARTATQLDGYFNALPISGVTWDYNIYTRPIAETSPIYYGGNLTLTQWKTASGKDVHSSTAGRTVSSDAELHFIYNNTNVNQQYTLSATMYEATGTGHTTYVTLTPFTSMVLIGAGTVTLTSSSGLSGDIVFDFATGKSVWIKIGGVWYIVVN